MILALRAEWFDKKVSFQEFVDKVSNYVVSNYIVSNYKVSNYIVSNFKDGGDIQPLFVDLIDPTKQFQTRTNL